MQKIGILIEMKNGAVKPANYGVIAAAHGEGHELFALVFDPKGAALQEKLQEYGIRKIVAIQSEQGALAWNPATWARAVVQAMAHYELNALLGLTSAQGKELLPRIAAYLDAPLVMDCLALNLSERTAAKSQFSGKTVATIQVKGRHQIFGIRPNVIEPRTRRVEAQGEAFTVKLEQEPLQVRELKQGAARGVDLSEADIIISGGRAMQNSENFPLLSECARILGAAVGASRVAVDSGWVPHSMQVGQTGTTVSPKLYVACGISGSIQHFAGMKTAKTIVAINTDPDAPMVKNSDYAIIGDLYEIVPILTRQLKERLAK